MQDTSHDMALEALLDSIGDEAEAVLSQAVKAGKPWAVCFTLLTFGKSRGYTTDNAELDAAMFRESLNAAEKGKA